MHREPVTIRPGDSWFQKITDARKTEIERSCRIRVIPIVDKRGRFQDILDLVITKQRTRLDAILMARARLRLGEVNYTPCKTNDDVEQRRNSYDTIRYNTQIAKYEAVAGVVNTRVEFEALARNRRIDEVYSALRRGGDWAAQVMGPGQAIQKRLQRLGEQMEGAKTSLLQQYMDAIAGRQWVGSETAHEKPDFIFILGCANSSEELQRVTAAQAYLQEIGTENKWLILSGGGRSPATTEAKRMKAKLSKDLVSRLGNRLVLEEDSLDTVGNAIFGWLTLVKTFAMSDETLRRLSKSKMTVVTSDYHALRTFDLFARVFSLAEICVHIARGDMKIDQRVKLAVSQLDSESRANRETFCLEGAATGAAENISDKHVRSMFFQLIKHHDQYRWRYDLVRKYSSVLTDDAGNPRRARPRKRRSRAREIADELFARAREVTKR